MRHSAITAALAATALVSLSACVTGVDPETKAALKQTLASVQELTDLWKERLGELDGGGQPDDDGGPTAGPTTSAEIKTHLGGLIDSFDTVTDGNTILGDSFLFRPFARNTPADLAWSDLKNSGLNYRRLTSRRGTSLALGEEHSQLNRTHFSYIGYAGWMDHNFFLVTGQSIDDRDPLAPSMSTFHHVYSIGDRTGRNPVVGSATWSGVMAGYSHDGKTITGDAGLTADFAARNIDLAFTTMVEQGGTARKADMAWTDVPVRGGSFKASGLLGHFYGPNHEEAGGIFNREGRMTGAFGAGRD